MDRDIAIAISDGLVTIKETMLDLVSNTTPSADSRFVSLDPAEDQRTAPAEDPEEPEAPDEEPEPVTKEKK